MTFQDRTSKFIVTELPGDLDTYTDVVPSIKMKQKQLICRAYLWLCRYGKQDSILLSICKIVRDSIWRPFLKL